MSFFTDEFEIYKLYDAVEIWKIAALLMGVKPSQIEPKDIFDQEQGCEVREYIILDKKHDQAQYVLVMQLILNSAISSEVNDVSSYENVNYSDQHNEYYAIRGKPYDAFVTLSSVRRWAQDRGFLCEFLDEKSNHNPSYLDASHPHYSKKLAAAVKVWLEFKDAEIEGKSVKQVLHSWLSGKSKEFDLMYNGKESKIAIEEIAKIANWETKGGAPKTPLMNLTDDLEEKILAENDSF